MLAYTLHDLGVLFQQQEKMQRAEKLYIKALVLKRRLFKSNPEAYRTVLLDTLKKMITLYKTINKSIDKLIKEIEIVQKIKKRSIMHL